LVDHLRGVRAYEIEHAELLEKEGAGGLGLTSRCSGGCCLSSVKQRSRNLFCRRWPPWRRTRGRCAWSGWEETRRDLPQACGGGRRRTRVRPDQKRSLPPPNTLESPAPWTCSSADRQERGSREVRRRRQKLACWALPSAAPSSPHSGGRYDLPYNPAPGKTPKAQGHRPDSAVDE